MKTLYNIAGILLLWLLNSCASTKELQYMQGSFDTTKLSAYTFPVPIIQKGDVISITVFSDAPAATALYNQSSSAGSAVGGQVSAVSTAPGYMVNEMGDIDFQGIGKLHVEGLNKSELTELLNSKLTKFLTNPYYNIRFTNYKITVIGDVARPSVYNIPAERVNLLEAIGLAGDLNITARRDNIRIVREINGKREFGEIDLRKPEIFLSPYYQLQQNDIVYVDFNKTKASANDQVTIRNITIGATLVSTIVLIYSILRR